MVTAVFRLAAFVRLSLKSRLDRTPASEPFTHKLAGNYPNAGHF